MTCSRVPQLMDVLLSIKMRVSKTLWSYASRYWELYNEIGGGNERIGTSTFKMGFLEDFELRESLMKRPPEDMRQLMRHIEEYKRLEEDGYRIGVRPRCSVNLGRAFFQQDQKRTSGCRNQKRKLKE